MMEGPTRDLPQAEVTHTPGRVITPLLLAAFLVSIGLLTLFAWLAREVFEGELSRFDLFFRMKIHGFASPVLTICMERVSFFGSVWFLTSASVALCLVFLVLHWRRAAAWLAADMIGAAVLDFTLKSAFHRPRPVAFFGVAPHSYSFPSGHALASLCFYWVLAGLLSARLPQRAVRVLLCPAYPRAYMRLERGEAEPWEAEEQRYEWEAPEASASGEYKPVAGQLEHLGSPGQGGTH